MAEGRKPPPPLIIEYDARNQVIARGWTYHGGGCIASRGDRRLIMASPARNGA